MAPPTFDTLILGCGYLGLRVARSWLQSGRSVAALTRRRGEELAEVGIHPIPGDVLDPESLKALPSARTILYAVGMDRSAGRSMREVYVDGLRNVIDALTVHSPEAKWVSVSSTGVYGQTDGSEVDEGSPTEPIEESGRVVLEAEQLLHAMRPGAVILRFAGIYGPNRLLRKEPILRGEPFIGDAEKWLNLIHVDDGVRAVNLAETRAPRGNTYLVSDGTPVKRRDYYSHLAEVLKAPPARFEPAPAKPEPNRRISNRRMVEELGFVPRFPSFREGLSNARESGS
jgi:nucleoside-diphosphate-sugar epimerase